MRLDRIRKEGIMPISTSIKPITKDEFTVQMSVLRTDTDIERRHKKMDALLCDVLCSLGYGDGVEVFKSAGRWYG